MKGTGSERSHIDEEMTRGIWVRHQAIGELEEQTRTELYEFAQKYLPMPMSVLVRMAVGKPADQIL